jgi:hypothetical protein
MTSPIDQLTPPSQDNYKELLNLITTAEWYVSRFIESGLQMTKDLATGGANE